MLQNKPVDKTRYTSFREFYPFYLSQHANTECRLLHFIGSLVVLVVLAFALLKQTYIWLMWLPVAGYAFAWIGHFVFEKNKPATFTYPFYSLMGDWVMFWDILTRKMTIRSQ